MRLAIIATCVIAVAAPALADPRDESDPHSRAAPIGERRAERMERSDVRVLPDPAAAGARDVRASERRMERMVARPASNEQPVLRDEDRREALGRVERRSRPEQMDERWRGNRRIDPVRALGTDPAADSVANWHREDRLRERNPAIPTGVADRWAGSGGNVAGGIVTAGWRDGWRRDGRYDWRDHRRHHNKQFHLGFYSDPFGWGYHPVGLGWTLNSNYYGARYSLADPWSYRLPLAPPGYRWVRYYDDALLVDLRSGQVVDVLHDLFW